MIVVTAGSRNQLRLLFQGFGVKASRARVLAAGSTLRRDSAEPPRPAGAGSAGVRPSRPAAGARAALKPAQGRSAQAADHARHRVQGQTGVKDRKGNGRPGFEGDRRKRLHEKPRRARATEDVERSWEPGARSGQSAGLHGAPSGILR